MKENHSKNSSHDNDGKQINKFNNKSNFSTFLKNINNQNPVNPVIINNNLKPLDKEDINADTTKNPSFKDIKHIIMKPSNVRSAEDVTLLNKYLLTTDLVKKLLRGKTDDNNLIKFLEKDEFIFRQGDVGDKFFIILEGSVNILDHRPYEKNLNGDGYFIHLIDLKRKGDSDLLIKTIQANKSIFPIDEEDLRAFKIEGIYMRYKLRNLFRVSSDKKWLKENISKFLKEFLLEKFMYDLPELEEKKIKNGVEITNCFDGKHYIDNEEKKLILSKNSQGINLNLYNYMDIKEEKEVKCFDYNIFLTLLKGQFFGDFALDVPNGLRKSSMNSCEDTHLGFLDQDVYKGYIYKEKMKYINKEIQFLHPNFFFKHIKVDIFRIRYFNYFTYHDYHKNKNIFSQGNLVDYIYFIKEGEIDISFDQTIITLNELVIKCSRLLGKAVNECKNLTTEFKEYSNELYKKRHIRIRIIGEFQCLGIEEFYFQIAGRIFTAKAYSDCVMLYRIDLNKLNVMSYEEKSLNYNLKAFAHESFSLFLTRLIELRTSLIEELNKKQIRRSQENKDSLINLIQEKKFMKAILKGPQISNSISSKSFLNLENEKNSTLRTTIQSLQKIKSKSTFITIQKTKSPSIEQTKLNKFGISFTRHGQKKSSVGTTVDSTIKKDDNELVVNEKFIWENQMKKKLFTLVNRRSNSMMNLLENNNNSFQNSHLKNHKSLPWSYFNKSLMKSQEDPNEKKQNNPNNLSLYSCEKNSNFIRNNQKMNTMKKKISSSPNSSTIYDLDKAIKNSINGYQMYSSFLGTQNRFVNNFKKTYYLNEILQDSYIQPKLDNEILKMHHDNECEELKKISRLPSLIYTSKLNYVYNNMKDHIKKKKKCKGSQRDFPEDLI